MKPFEYVEAKIPFYPPRRRRQAEPITKMQKPLSAEESMKHLVTPVDFEVKLFVDRGEARRQADRDDLGRPRPALGRRHGRLPQRTQAPRARAATGS